MIFVKKIIPKFILSFARALRKQGYHIIDSHKSFLCHYKYCNYKIYYTKGNGLINRVRFGNPDRIYERNLVENICRDIKKIDAPVILDVGANIGLISFYILSKIPNVKIYAFEPGLSQNLLFRISIFTNRVTDKIILNNEALGNENKEQQFISHDDINNSGDGYIDTERGGLNKKIITVKSITLDNWWESQNYPKIDLIKIDTEGAELWILQGGKNFFNKCKPIIYLEISILNLKNYPYSHRDIFNWLIENNYQLSTIDNIICTNENFDALVLNEDSFIARYKK